MKPLNDVIHNNPSLDWKTEVMLLEESPLLAVHWAMLKSCNGGLSPNGILLDWARQQIRPEIKKPEQDEIKESEKNLTQKIENELLNNDIKFFFEVQRFKDKESTPIEDARKSWGDETSFETIAELIIPKDSKNEIELVDKLAFSPWNVDPSNFKPLGNMNRSRKKVYWASVEERKK